MCTKKPLEKVLAELIVARNLSVPVSAGTKRRETRWYYCKECKACHLTSKPKTFKYNKKDKS